MAPPAQHSGPPEQTLGSSLGRSGLAARTLGGALATVGGRLATAAVQFVSTVFLARLLTPDAFGLVAMVAPVVIMISVFRDAGLSTATTQAKEITHEQVSGLFWANVALGLVFTGVVSASAPVLANFFSREEILVIAPVYALSMLISSLSTQHEALLRRDMNFRALAIISFGAAFSSAAVAIVLAWYGLGYWALVAMAAVNAVFILIGAWIAMPWRPALPRRNVGLRKLVRFGAYVAGGNFLYAISQNAVPIVIGRTIGAPDLGLFNRASRLTELVLDQFTSPLTHVIMPAFSKLQDDESRMRRAVTQVLEKAAILTCFLAGTLLVSGDILVVLLFGEAWRDAGLIVQILAIGSLVSPVGQVVTSTVVSLGHSKVMFYWNGASAAIRLTFVIVGSVWGLVGAATGVTLSLWLGGFLFTMVATRHVPISLGSIIGATKSAGLAVSTSVGMGLLVRVGFPVPESVVGLGVLLIVFLTAYAATIAASADGRRILHEMLVLARGLLRRSELGAR